MKRNYIEKSKVPTGQKSLQLLYACRSIYKSNTRVAFTFANVNNNASSEQ